MYKSINNMIWVLWFTSKKIKTKAIINFNFQKPIVFSYVHCSTITIKYVTLCDNEKSRD
jgi:hypothetical protein